jgi:hypothetical protein
MKKLLSYAFLLMGLSGLLALSSCKDDDEETRSRTQLLTEKTWKLTSVKALGFSSSPEDCDADDIYTFTTGGAYSENEGATKCDVDAPQTLSGSWEFESNETILNISYVEQGATVSFDYTIVELTGSTLKLRISVFGLEVENTYSH